MSNQFDQSKQELDKLYCYGTKIISLVKDDIEALAAENDYLDAEKNEAKEKYNDLKQNLEDILNRTR